MSVYLTFFNYTPEGAAAISSRRTDEAKKIIKKEKGKFISAYGVMGPYDAMIIAEYPNEKAATKAIIELC
ncbi:MAG: GYD domain-containing protein, partial [Candidatus Bathyarchaeia archaeon]